MAELADVDIKPVVVTASHVLRKGEGHGHVQGGHKDTEETVIF